MHTVNQMGGIYGWAEVSQMTPQGGLSTQRILVGRAFTAHRK
eukprot:COSAG05_NODE_8357_length_711_cov_1.192810_1_plen_41_part_10